MTIQNLFEKIEDFAFSARVDVASGIEIFRTIAFDQSEVIQLQSRIKKEGSYQKICARTLELCNRKIDSQYANPWDVPIAVYLDIVKDNSLSDTYILAHIVKSTSNLFWAREVALDVLSKVESQEDKPPYKVSYYNTSSDKGENHRNLEFSWPVEGRVTATAWYCGIQYSESSSRSKQICIIGAP